MPLKRFVVPLLVVGALLSVIHGAQNEPEGWIRANAIRLTTPEAGHGFADMQPLKKVIGNARIVSLGEATHGSREFFQLKHRMLEFLATEMGFTIFSIEANMPEAYRLNDYVLNGTGDPAQLLKGMYFWTWDTEEVLAMIQWMREFNASGKGRVQFTGFDMQTPTVAAAIARDFVSKYDTAYTATMAEAARSAAAPAAQGNAFGVATASFPIAIAAGKRVRFSGYIKTESITRGFAGLWWRVDGPSGVLAFDNMQSRGAKGSTDWQPFVLELPVDASVKNINFGALMPGDGTAWFDDLTVELDGKPFVDPNLFDFQFESSTVKGMYIGGAGYQVQLDPQVAHGGKQSLRMRYVGPVTAPPAGPDPKVGVSQWSGVVEHLQAGRAGYRQGGAADRDIDWAVQNARVVLQTLQMRTGQVSRDQSMADNVKWILDQNPGAKVVLWAHNGHVATGGFSYAPMGAALRKMFGAGMVVFGFSFNQGAFQAIQQGGTAGLKTFTVPPAPAGSLDAMLASSGIPLFALDVRQAPAWFRTARSSRQIGAVYPEDSQFALMGDIVAPEAFDAMLFVETTTTARKNPGR